MLRHFDLSPFYLRLSSLFRCLKGFLGDRFATDRYGVDELYGGYTNICRKWYQILCFFYLNQHIFEISSLVKILISKLWKCTIPNRRDLMIIRKRYRTDCINGHPGLQKTLFPSLNFPFRNHQIFFCEKDVSHLLNNPKNNREFSFKTKTANSNFK